MKFNLKNFTIKTKLFGIIAVVAFVMLINTIQTIVETRNSTTKLHRLEDLTQISAKISLLLHETQKERGASAGFVGSHGKKFIKILPKQRTLTDKRLKEFKQTLTSINLNEFNPDLRHRIQIALNALSKLNEIRRGVSNLKLPLKDVVGYYTSTNAKLLKIVEVATNLAPSARLTKSLNSYTNFLKSKERAGVERAVLSGTFAANEWKSGFYAKFITLLAEQKAYLDASMATATPYIKNFYKNTMNSPIVTEVKKMEQIAKTHMNGNFGVDSVYWFKTITNKINLLKKIDDEMSRYNFKLLKEIEYDIYKNLYINIGILFIFIFFMFIPLFMLQKDLIKDITIMKNELDEIATNLDLSKRLTVNGKDEIAQMSAHINHFLEIINNLTANIKNNALTVNSVANQTAKESNLLTNVLEAQKTTIESISESTNSIQVDIASAEEKVIDTAEKLENAYKALDKMITHLDEVTSKISQNSEQELQIASAVTSLAEQSKQVGDVVIIIKEIAEQTNLLALNAAIEAARAGEHGRGFAVVADEVRKLAERTQKSIIEIESVINMMLQSVNNIESEMVELSEDANDVAEITKSLVSFADETKEQTIQTIKISQEASAQTTKINFTLRTLLEASKITMEKTENLTEVATTLHKISNESKKVADELEKEVEKFRI